MADNERMRRQLGLSRRDLLRRGAIVGGTLLWTVPVVSTLSRAHPQNVRSPAFTCCECSHPRDVANPPFFCAPERRTRPTSVRTRVRTPDTATRTPTSAHRSSRVARRPAAPPTSTAPLIAEPRCHDRRCLRDHDVCFRIRTPLVDVARRLDELRRLFALQSANGVPTFELRPYRDGRVRVYLDGELVLRSDLPGRRPTTSCGR